MGGPARGGGGGCGVGGPSGILGAPGLGFALTYDAAFCAFAEDALPCVWSVSVYRLFSYSSSSFVFSPPSLRTLRRMPFVL